MSSCPASMLLIPNKPFTGPSAFKRVSSSAVNISGAVISIFSSVFKITFFESNEAFAAQAIAVNRGLNLDPAIVNPNGGAIALGHPVGATGAIITLKALYQLDNINGKRALITMCIGGGQGIALAIERI